MVSRPHRRRHRPLADEDRFRFSTKYWDPATGLGYWGYRWYGVEWGRWVSRDPIGEEGDRTLVRFCLNAPVGAVDALGQIAVVFEPSESSFGVNHARTIRADAQTVVAIARRRSQEAMTLSANFAWAEHGAPRGLCKTLFREVARALSDISVTLELVAAYDASTISEMLDPSIREPDGQPRDAETSPLQRHRIKVRTAADGSTEALFHEFVHLATGVFRDADYSEVSPGGSLSAVATATYRLTPLIYDDLPGESRFYSILIRPIQERWGNARVVLTQGLF